MVTMRLTLAGAAVVLALLVAGCGSSGSQADQVKSAVGSLTSAVADYDRAAPSSVAATAAACRKAHDAIAGDTVLLHPSQSGPNSRAEAALARAYALALRGFRDCAASAPYNYPLMAAAQSELEEANSWLRIARG